MAQVDSFVFPAIPRRELVVLQGLDVVPWADLEHASGSAVDVPDLLRKLLDPDPKVRNETLGTLSGFADIGAQCHRSGSLRTSDPET
jgi:hypothetical protein